MTQPRTKIRLTRHPIDVAAATAGVASPYCGATVVFLGTTREFDGDRQTTTLNYEAYEPMAELELSRLAEIASSKWPIRHVWIEHRLGNVPVGECSILISLSSPHRAEAFAASSWLMDEIKKSVPIWKQENFATGETEWMHPGPRAPDHTTPSSAES